MCAKEIEFVSVFLPLQERDTSCLSGGVCDSCHAPTIILMYSYDH